MTKVVDNRIPERRASDGEADESGHGRGDLEPAPDLVLVSAATEDDAADVAPVSAPRSLDEALTVLAGVETLDLPDIRFDPVALPRSLASRSISAPNSSSTRMPARQGGSPGPSACMNPS